MITFEEFKHTRYNEAPYDLHTNPIGFDRHVGSDISAHLPFLEFLAKQCRTIVEFGTRDCYSTCAFLAGKPLWLKSYDIEITHSIRTLQTMTDLPCKWVFEQKSTIDPQTVIPLCDLLFIDTLHTYKQVKEELCLHADKVDRFILFHDTVSFPEINHAIQEFIDEHLTWHKVYEAKFNHGLLLLENYYQ
jgi:hypothetical protein